MGPGMVKRITRVFSNLSTMQDRNPSAASMAIPIMASTGKIERVAESASAWARTRVSPAANAIRFVRKKARIVQRNGGIGAAQGAHPPGHHPHAEACQASENRWVSHRLQRAGDREVLRDEEQRDQHDRKQADGVPTGQGDEDASKMPTTPSINRAGKLHRTPAPHNWPPAAPPRPSPRDGPWTSGDRRSPPGPAGHDFTDSRGSHSPERASPNHRDRRRGVPLSVPRLCGLFPPAATRRGATPGRVIRGRRRVGPALRAGDGRPLRKQPVDEERQAAPATAPIAIIVRSSLTGTGAAAPPSGSAR